MPDRRFFPTSARVDRWLVSSEVEPDGVVLGHITARLRENGRIEVGFNPAKGERILPRARFFPPTARVEGAVAEIVITPFANAADTRRWRWIRGTVTDLAGNPHAEVGINARTWVDGDEVLTLSHGTGQLPMACLRSESLRAAMGCR